MNKKYDVRKVKLGSFNGKCTGGHAAIAGDGKAGQIIFAELNEKSFKETTCVIDWERESAIDIFSGEIYLILRRDKKNRIVESADQIKPDVYYVLNVMTEEKLTDSKIYNIYCQYLAQNTISEYNKNLGKQKDKIKTKKKVKKD